MIKLLKYTHCSSSGHIVAVVDILLVFVGIGRVVGVVVWVLVVVSDLILGLVVAKVAFWDFGSREVRVWGGRHTHSPEFQRNRDL